jgi:hypothetical protein
MLTFKVRWQFINKPASARTEIVRARDLQTARTAINRKATRTEHVVIIKIEELFDYEAANIAHLSFREQSAGDGDEGTRYRRHRRRGG